MGHIFSGEGISVDPAKVVAVQDWKKLESATDVRSFLGLVGFYRRFIKDFSKIASHLTKLMKKDAKFL